MKYGQLGKKDFPERSILLLITDLWTPILRHGWRPKLKKVSFFALLLH